MANIGKGDTVTCNPPTFPRGEQLGFGFHEAPRGILFLRSPTNCAASGTASRGVWIRSRASWSGIRAVRNGCRKGPVCCLSRMDQLYSRLAELKAELKAASPAGKRTRKNAPRARTLR